MNNLLFIKSETGKGTIPYYVAKENLDILSFCNENKNLIEDTLLLHGGILLRGFSIRSVSEFNKLAQIISPQLLEYTNRSTPRTNIGGKIYTATEYPANKHIPLHNENSYTLKWPNKIFFFSVIVAETGGETPIADSRIIYKKLDKKIVDKFDAKKVLYVRNYTPGIDLSWQDVFQTQVKEDVNQYCNENNIEYEWYDNHPNGVELTTKQICQATLSHHITQEKVWFNQAHLFHKSSLDHFDLEALIAGCGKDFLPRNSYYGDGEEIDQQTLNHIKDIFESEKIIFKWQKGDVMILDNVLMAHSRHPFTGERKVVVAMG